MWAGRSRWGRCRLLVAAALLWGCAGPQEVGAAEEPAGPEEGSSVQEAPSVEAAALRPVPAEAYAAFARAVLLSSQSSRLRGQALRLRFFDPQRAKEVSREATQLWIQAREAFEKAVQLDPQGQAPLRHLASALARRGDNEEAIPYLEKLLRLAPEDLRVRIELALLYKRAGRLEEARQQYRRLLELSARSGLQGLQPALYVGLVELTAKLEGLAAAVGPLAEALEGYPEAAVVRRAVEEMVGLAAQEEGFAQRAEKVVPEGKRGFGFYYLVGRVAFARQDWAASVDYLKRATEARPGFWPARAQLSLALAAAERTEEALAVLDEAPEAEAAPGMLELLRGSVLLRARRYPEARTALEKAVQADLANLAARYALAGVYEKLGLLDEAIELLKGNLAMNPDHADSLNALGYFYAEKSEQLGQAEKLIRRALEREPDNGAYLDSLGWVFFKQGRLQEALQTLTKAAERLADPVVYEHVGDVYRELDQPAEAARWWRRALELDPEQTSLREKLQAPGPSGTSPPERRETTHSTE